MLIDECVTDFPDDDNSEIAEYAAKIAQASITKQTWTGHLRCIAHFHQVDGPDHRLHRIIIYHLPHEAESKVGC
jgi:hypothetical protein